MDLERLQDSPSTIAESISSKSVRLPQSGLGAPGSKTSASARKFGTSDALDPEPCGAGAAAVCHFNAAHWLQVTRRRVNEAGTDLLDAAARD